MYSWPFRDRVCFVINCSSYFLVFVSKLPLIFFLFHSGAMNTREKFSPVRRLNHFFNFIAELLTPYIMTQKWFQRKQTVNVSIKCVQYEKATILSFFNSTFVSPIYTFFWREA